MSRPRGGPGGPAGDSAWVQFPSRHFVADLELSPLAAGAWGPSLEILVSQSLWSRVEVLEGTEPSCCRDCTALSLQAPHFGQRKSDRKARGLGVSGAGTSHRQRKARAGQ